MASARRTKRGKGRKPTVNNSTPHCRPSRAEDRHENPPAPLCNHGLPMPDSSDYLRAEFTRCLFGALHKHTYLNQHRDLASFAQAIDTVQIKYPEAFNDEAFMESLRAHFVSVGTEVLLDLDDGGSYDDLHETILGYWLAATILFVEKKSVLKCSGLKNQDIFGGCQRALIRFFSKRAPCSCLNDTYVEATFIPKTGLCAHCNERKKRKALLICTSCNERQFCSNKCQAADWPHHQKFCKPRYRENATIVGDCRCMWCRNSPTEAILSASVTAFVGYCRDEFGWLDVGTIVYSIHCCGAKGDLYYLGVLCVQKSLRGVLWAWLTYNNEFPEQLPLLFQPLVAPLSTTGDGDNFKVHFLHILSAGWNHLVMITWLFYNRGYLSVIAHTAVYSGGSYFLCSPKWKELKASMILLVIIAMSLADGFVRVLLHPSKEPSHDWPERWPVMIWFFYTYGICCGVLYTSAYAWGKDILPVIFLYDLLALLP